MDNIDAIILAGGLGTRLSASAGNLPKALMPVNGKPFLEILFNLLHRVNSINKVVVATGYRADKIISKYKNCTDYGFEIFFTVETELLGTGGAIKKALLHTNSEDVLVLNGDTYVDIDIRNFYAAHKKKDAGVTVALTQVENANRYGKVNISNGHKIMSFEEKVSESSGGYINAGMYLFNRNLFDRIPENAVLSLEKDLLPEMIKSDAYGFICTGKFIDIGLPETYTIASDYLKEET